MTNSISRIRDGNAIKGASMNQGVAQNKARAKNPIDVDHPEVDDDF